jgi:hypothetical protein
MPEAGSSAYPRAMTFLEKLLLAAALVSALIIVLRKAGAYEEASREELRDAAPRRPEPLPADDLRIAQNAPL